MAGEQVIWSSITVLIALFFVFLFCRSAFLRQARRGHLVAGRTIIFTPATRNDPRVAAGVRPPSPAYMGGLGRVESVEQLPRYEAPPEYDKVVAAEGAGERDLERGEGVAMENMGVAGQQEQPQEQQAAERGGWRRYVPERFR